MVDLKMKLGWCMTGHHAQCRQRVASIKNPGLYYACNCPCHQGEPDGAETALRPTDT